LTCRHLDLRRPKSFQRWQTRDRATCAIRIYLDENGFLEIEIAYLFKTTSEMAREFWCQVGNILGICMPLSNLHSRTHKCWWWKR
jgi:aspartyl-tRNA synthetase